LWRKPNHHLRSSIKGLKYLEIHDEKDGIVDISCMRKLQTQLQLNGYPSAPAFLLQPAGPKNALLHLWRTSYNAPLLDFFASFTP
jgi:hypothetical protein